MTYSLVIRPAALLDVAEARDWYDEHEEGVGDRFVDAVDATVRRIVEAPKNFQAGYRGVRPALANPIPYVIRFRIKGPVIEIVAVLHGHRHPRVWTSRL